MSDVTIQDPFLNYEDAAKFLGDIGVGQISARTIEDWAQSGKLPFIKRPGGRGRVIKKSALQRWFDNQQRLAEQTLEQESRGSARVRK